MKCPECGLWNRASQPHCIRCGTPLNIDEASRSAWKDSLRDSGASTTYLRADEFGLTDQTPEPRDALAGEMQDLKRRKQRGAELQERLRAEAAEEASARVTVTEKTTEDACTVHKTYILSQETENDRRARRESEMRSRVRYLDENGEFVEARSYDPLVPESFRHTDDPLPRRSSRYLPKKRHLFLRILLAAAILVLVIGGGYLVLKRFIPTGTRRTENPPGVVITAGILDDLSAHTVLIPGTDGSTIYIRELHASYIVDEGFATVEIPDHIWYDNLEGSLDETMDVTLTPFLKSSSGRQIPMDPVNYTIAIPLSPISLDTPDTMRKTVSTTMFTIKVVVLPGSRVTINGDDYSDTVSSSTGALRCNAPEQPIGDNEITIHV